MTQLQAVGLVVAFAMALALTVTFALFITALAYEARDRLSTRRARRAAATTARNAGQVRVITHAGPTLDELRREITKPHTGMTGRWSN